VLGLAPVVGLEPEVVVRVSPIQADGGGEFLLSLHTMLFLIQFVHGHAGLDGWKTL
jgi:hypothetical protein